MKSFKIKMAAGDEEFPTVPDECVCVRVCVSLENEGVGTVCPLPNAAPHHPSMQSQLSAFQDPVRGNDYMQLKCVV